MFWYHSSLVGVKKGVILPKRKWSKDSHWPVKCLFTESEGFLAMKSGQCNNPASPMAREREQRAGQGQGDPPSPPAGPTSILRLLSKQAKAAGSKCPRHASHPHPLTGILPLPPHCQQQGTALLHLLCSLLW